MLPIQQFCKQCNQPTVHKWDKTNEHYFCHECHLKSSRKYRKTAKAKAKEKIYAKRPYRQHSIRKRRIKESLVVLFGAKCSSCGLEDPCLSIYDFHHKNPNQKDVNISRLVSWEQAVKEASKCDLVCANCHRRIHSQLRQAKRKIPITQI